MAEPGAGSHDGKAWLASVFDRAAPTYDTAADAYHDHFGERLVERAGIAPGDAVLDVACGRGAVLVPAARRAGPTGRAVGVDLSPEMVRLARAALDAAGLAGDALVMDAEHLDLPPSSFDAALCAFGVFFFPEPERAMAELARVLVPGGVCGLSTWADEDERWAWEDELLADVEVARRAVQRPFDQAAEVEALLHGAGFGKVTATTEQHEVWLADEAEWWTWKWSYSLRGLLEQLDESRVERFRAEAFERMQPLREPDGFPVALRAHLVIARRGE